LEQLQAIPGFGPNTAQGIVDWFERPRNQKLLQKLRRAGVWPRRAGQALEQVQTLSGRTFVVTGTLPEFSRSEAKAFIEAHGGKVTGSVSTNTDYLVLGENPGSKYDKAQTLGIPVIDEVGLRRLALGSSEGRPEA
jgi:DNA ligase (NAD+)